MAETANYKLHLTDDSRERFQDWRNAMNGPNNSNMTKIDMALGEKADRSAYIYTVLLSTAWSAQHAQTLYVDGLGQSQNGTISVTQTATLEQRLAAREAALTVTGQEEGKLIITVDGKIPEIDIPVVVTLLG